MFRLDPQGFGLFCGPVLNRMSASIGLGLNVLLGAAFCLSKLVGNEFREYLLQLLG